MAIRPTEVIGSVRSILAIIGISALCGVLFAGLALPVNALDDGAVGVRVALLRGVRCR